MLPLCQTHVLMLFTARSLECSCIKYQQLAYQSSVLCLGRLGINNSFCNGDGIRIHRLTWCTRLWNSSQPRLEVYDSGEHWQIERKLRLDSRQLFKYRQEQLQLQSQPQEALLIIPITWGVRGSPFACGTMTTSKSLTLLVPCQTKLWYIRQADCQDMGCL